MINMRVTVCFGQTRVIVPCKGGATVAELVKEACARYKRAIGKSAKYRVKIRQLENAVDGGILDVDDYVYDVAEDRDQLIAVFEEEDNQSYHFNGWDHQSGSSSDGRRSPLSYQQSSRYSNEKSNDKGSWRAQQAGNATIIKHNPQGPGLEVDVGLDALKSSTLITVRRESDSLLKNEENRNDYKSEMNKSKAQINGPHLYYGRRESGSGQEEDSHRFFERNHHIMTSTINSSPEQSRNLSAITMTSSDTNNSIDPARSGLRERNAQKVDTFVRDSTRQSMMGVLADRYETELDVRDSIKNKGMRQPPDGRKRSSSDYEDLSGSCEYGYQAERYTPPPPSDKSKFPWFYNDSQEMFVDVDDRPLGVQILSYKDKGIFCGLCVKSVDVGGRAEREGLLQQGDVIVEINNYVLAQFSLSVAQEIFKNAMRYPELQLRVYPVEERERVASKVGEQENNFLNANRHAPSIPILSLIDATPPKSGVIASAKSLPDLNASCSSKSARDSDVSADCKQPLIARMSYDTLSNNTRKIGNMFEIELRKGDQGLGFSITTRDTPVGDPGPIYIKNILPKGAAIQDGRLQAGDRLLKVNDIELTGHTQESAVNILRCIQVGSVVGLVVSRHVNTLPRKMKEDPVADQILNDDAHREYYMFEIALNDTGSAGLGISLKGNQSKKTGKDLGIFVKSVFTGGAAYQDGRLRPNDQLVSVNGQSLNGMTNHEAIDTLRKSMSTVGNVRGMIQMVIARRKISKNPTSPHFSSEASSELSDSILTERNSRLSASKYNHSRQKSAPPARSRALSPSQDLFEDDSHFRQFSDISYTSSILSTSLGDDANWWNSNDSVILDNLENFANCDFDSRRMSRESRTTLGTSSRQQYSTSSRIKRSVSLRRQASLKGNSSNLDRNNFATTINRYTQSTPVSNGGSRNIIADLLRSAEVDNHYKPRPLTQRSSTPKPYVKNQRPLSRSHSLKSPRYKDSCNSKVPVIARTWVRSQRTSGVGSSHPKMEEMSPFDNLTAFEITGNSRMDCREDNSFHFNEEIPRQIDPCPMEGYGDRSYHEPSSDPPDEWPASPDTPYSDDPFSRESIFRQSISEKRRGAATRDAQNTDTYKAIKSKQTSSSDIDVHPTKILKAISICSINLETIERDAMQGSAHGI